MSFKTVLLKIMLALLKKARNSIRRWPVGDMNRAKSTFVLYFETFSVCVGREGGLPQSIQRNENFDKKNRPRREERESTKYQFVY